MTRNKSSILEDKIDVENEESLLKNEYSVIFITKTHIYMMDENGNGAHLEIGEKYKDVKVGDKIYL